MVDLRLIFYRPLSREVATNLLSELLRVRSKRSVKLVSDGTVVTLIKNLERQLATSGAEPILLKRALIWELKVSARKFRPNTSWVFSLVVVGMCITAVDWLIWAVRNGNQSLEKTLQDPPSVSLTVLGLLVFILYLISKPTIKSI